MSTLKPTLTHAIHFRNDNENNGYSTHSVHDRARFLMRNPVSKLCTPILTSKRSHFNKRAEEINNQVFIFTSFCNQFQ